MVPKMNELQVFSNKEFGEVRTLGINGDPWFVGKDVAAALGYSNTKDAIITHIDEEDRTVVQRSEIATLGNNLDIPNRGLTIINESGLYSLIFSSKLESAKSFKRWVTSEVLPALRKTGSYRMNQKQADTESLDSVNNAVKILMPMLEEAGCGNKIQLLTAKQLYAKSGVELPIEISADKRYWDSVYIARKVGIRFASSGKPADKAVIEIIRKIGVTPEDYTDTWESKGKWQGAVRKYSDAVIQRVSDWIGGHNYPSDIAYTQNNGEDKAYHVIYQK